MGARPLPRHNGLLTTPLTLKGADMKEEMKAITERLDLLQGTCLAQQVFLVAIAQDLQRKDWMFLMDKDGPVEECLAQLRYSNASDMALSSFQQTTALLHQKLSAVAPENLPF
jgi:hypothetical protein